MPEQWLSMSAACDIAGVVPSTLARWAREEKVEGVIQAGAWKVSRPSLERFLEARENRLTWVEARTLIGCSEPTLQRLIEGGSVIKVAGVARRGSASLDRQSVEQAALAYRAARASREQMRRERDRPRDQPPDDEEVWVTSNVASRALGVSANRIRQRVASGTMPGVVRKGKLWLRRRDVEIAAAAAAFRSKSQGPA